MTHRSTLLAGALLTAGIATFAAQSTLGQQPPMPAGAPATITALGSPTAIRKFNVTVRRFDPAKASDAGETFVLPVDCTDEEHAASAVLSNVIAWTKKTDGGGVLPVAFTCVEVRERG